MHMFWLWFPLPQVLPDLLHLPHPPKSTPFLSLLFKCFWNNDFLPQKTCVKLYYKQRKYWAPVALWPWKQHWLWMPPISALLCSWTCVTEKSHLPAYSRNSQTCLSSVCIPAKHHASGSCSCFRFLLLPKWLPELRNYPKRFSFSPPLRPLWPTSPSQSPPNYNLTGGKMFPNLHLAFSPLSTPGYSSW